MSEGLFRWRSGAKRHLDGCAHAVFPCINIEFVAHTSILDQIALVPKTDHTGAPSDFTLWPPINTVSMGRKVACGIEKAMQERDDKFRGGEGHTPFSNSLLH